MQDPKVTVPGIVSVVYPKLCNVILESDLKTTLLCTYRRAKVFEREPEWLERSPVAPGDRVEVTVLGSRDGIVESIIPRRNCIQRKAPGKEGKVLHTLAANIDYVVMVASLHEPEFSFGLIDRFLIATQAAEIEPILVINKIDLDLNHQKPWTLYENLGIRCFPLSTVDCRGIQDLNQVLMGKTVVFCGHSGVGKTSLLNLLIDGGQLSGKVGTVNSYTGKGKHTTTVSSMMITDAGSKFIDTPGIKEFGLFKITEKTLMEYFPEIQEVHLQRNPIDQLPRYESYQRILAALKDENR